MIACEMSRDLMEIAESELVQDFADDSFERPRVADLFQFLALTGGSARIPLPGRKARRGLAVTCSSRPLAAAPDRKSLITNPNEVVATDTRRLIAPSCPLRQTVLRFSEEEPDAELRLKGAARLGSRSRIVVSGRRLQQHEAGIDCQRFAVGGTDTCPVGAGLT